MKKIAIIDDDIYIGNMPEELLQGNGYDVLRAYSGTEALFLLSQNKPDLVLLDLMLPGLSGEEVLPKIQDNVTLLSPEFDILVCLYSWAKNSRNNHCAATVFTPKPLHLRVPCSTLLPLTVSAGFIIILKNNEIENMQTQRKQLLDRCLHFLFLPGRSHASHYIIVRISTLAP